MKKSLYFLIIFLAILSNRAECLKFDNPYRTFYMGFTPWIYDASSWDFFVDTYQRINDNGDIVAHHIQGGIPWQEAYNNEAYHPNVEEDIAQRLEYTEENKIIYLAIDCLNSSRDGLNAHWGENFNEELAPPWGEYSFDSPEIIEAYSNFAIDIIGRFNPAYFSYGTEVSELILNDPVKFEQFKIFAAGVYSNIKSAYPSLPLLVSVALKNPESSDAQTIKTKMAEMNNYYDILGISSYGYIFYELFDQGGNPANLPDQWLQQAKQIAAKKPMAITETAWLAEDFTLEEPINFTVTGTPHHQNNYLEKMFLEANDLDLEFIIWFSILDYDRWQSQYGNGLSRIWQDTGLWSEESIPRVSAETWRNWLMREKR